MVGFRLHVEPADGLTPEVKLTTPLKPCTTDTVIVEVPAIPAMTVTLDGVGARAKSWTVYVTVAE
jgi:hypothetical protein